jgi:cytochrome c
MAHRIRVLTAVIAWGVSAISAPSMAQEPPGDAAAGKAVFQSQCSICHSPQRGRNLVGPSLFNLFGRPAGHAPGYQYSDATKTANITWEPATLDPYLTNPKSVIPQTRMPYPGLKDAHKRADLIAYLGTLH